jgi:electron transfer flavoprotein alpha subunit
MAKNILAILEQREGIIKKSSFEVISMAAKLAKLLNADAEALVIGNEIENLNDISNFGINKVTHFRNSELSNYSTSAYSGIIKNYAAESGFEYILLSNTAMGRDLAPNIAVKLNAGCIPDITDITVADNEVFVIRPVYAGKALQELTLLSEVKVLTIRPNVFPPAKTDTVQETSIVVKEISSPDLSNRVVDFKKAEGKIDVTEADIVVSGGRGLKEPENFKLVENLAEVLGAAVGASRAVVDAGWRPHNEQVGQTGKTVSPTLYVACGISGAIQHLAGMSSSKYIVAINKDKDAPIFGIADYGITGDALEIIPLLTDEIKKVKS